MAAPPPSNPVPPHDGSGAFRRPSRTVSKALPGDFDELQALEPSDLLDFDDGESVPLEVTPLPVKPPLATALPTHATHDAVDSLLPELPNPNFGSGDVSDLFDLSDAALGDNRSSILKQPSFEPAKPGAEWLDDDNLTKTQFRPLDDSELIRPEQFGPHDFDDAPMTNKFDSAAQLFAELGHAGVPDSNTPWVEQQTGRYSEQELHKAFDDVRSDLPEGEVDLDFEALDSAEGSNLFADYHRKSTRNDEGDAVNFLDPESAGTDGPASSIFKTDGSEESSVINIEEIPLLGSTDDPQIAELFAHSGDGLGSSIFEREIAAEVRKRTAERISSEAAGFELPKSDAASNASGRIEWSGAESGEFDAEKSRIANYDELDISLHDEVFSSNSGEPSSIFGDSTEEEVALPAALASKSPKRFDETDERAPILAAAVGAGALGSATPTKKQKKPTTKVKAPERAMPSKPAALDLEDDRDARRRSSGLGKFIGGASLGLLAGGLGFAGLYFGGVIPNGSGSSASNKTAVTAPSTGPAPAPQIAANDPAAQVVALDRLTDEQLTPTLFAQRGQARLQVQFAKLAGGEASDAAELKKAEADLEVVVAKADPQASIEDKQAGVRAALHLGLMKEVAGDLDGALAVYSMAAEKFPFAKRVFETAAQRVRLMAKPGREGRAALDRTDAVRLLHAAIFASILLQGDAKDEPKLEDEPGFAFWEAVNAAAKQDFKKASESITIARAAHEKLRLKLVGKNANALSDPQEQIFLQTCDDLKELYSLKASLYQSPNSADVAKKSGATKALEAVLAGTTGNDKLVADYKKASAALLETEGKLKVAGLDLDKAMADLKAARIEATDIKEAAAKAIEDEKKKVKLATDDYQKAKKEFDAAMVRLMAAETEVASAKDAAKKADTSLAAIVAELKSAKIIDEKANVTKLGPVIKTLALTATSTDAKKAAATIKKAQEDLEVAGKQLKEALSEQSKLKSSTEDAVAAAKKAMDDVERSIKAAKETADKQLAAMAAKLDERVDAAVANAKANLEGQIRQAKEAAVLAEEKRKQQDATMAARLAEARSGASTVLTTDEAQLVEKAKKTYDDGVKLFDGGRFSEAEATFSESAGQFAGDARTWYFLGLSKWQQGRTDDAEADFKKGAELEARNRPSAKAVGAALERVQFDLRKVLSARRP